MLARLFQSHLGFLPLHTEYILNITAIMIKSAGNLKFKQPSPNTHLSYRFLQAEAGPWGHLSPSPRSPTRTPALSPGAVSQTSQHLSPGASPGGPSPTSPGGTTAAAAAGGSSRLPPQSRHRGRTSSMPAVPRHRVSLILRVRLYILYEMRILKL